VNNTHVLFTGGSGDGNYYDDCYWFDIERSTFSSAGHLRGGPRAYHGCTKLLDGRIMIAAGNVMSNPPFGSPSSSVVILDTSDMSWTDGFELPQKLQALTLVTVSGNVMSLGGSPEALKYVGTVYVLGSHGWNQTTSMKDPRGYFTAFSIPGLE